MMMAATEIGPYFVEEQLRYSEGTLRPVYFGINKETGKRVVLKGCSDEGRPEEAKRFLKKEYDIHSSLNHPNICPVIGLENHGEPFIVLPRIEASNLEECIERGTIGPEKCVQVLSDVADALHYFNKRGIVHNDVKERNVLVHNGRGLLIDFGSAQYLNRPNPTADLDDGMFNGTVVYAAPEYWRESRVTSTTDGFQLGMMAYFVITGDVAYDVEPGRHIMGLRYDEPLFEPELLDEYGRLGRLLIELLEKDPEKRPSMGLISDGFKEYLRTSRMPLRTPESETVKDRK